MLEHAENSLKIVREVLGDDKLNYHHAKALAIVGRAYLTSDRLDDAEKTMLEAQSIIYQIYGERSPIAVKYNNHILEVYNKQKDDTPEKTKRSTDIVDKNFEIIKELWGPDHFFSIRLYLSMYISSQVRFNGDQSGDIYDQMKLLKYQGQVIADNRFIFKAQI